jgi:hypothetical protein
VSYGRKRGVTDADLSIIEERLAVTLPEIYRATVRDYPFSSDSIGAECMLLDSAAAVVELNEVGLEIDGVTSPFFIGSDLSEEWYFLDVSRAESPVYVYQLEAGEHQVLDETMGQYLDRIRVADAEIEADRRAAEERDRNKKWWEFWK